MKYDKHMRNTNKIDVKKTLQIHSLAKIEFYKEYLKRYLRPLTLSPHIDKINIYDVFCGMGIYEDGGKGSPIAAFDAIKEFSEDPISKKGEADITLIINDINKLNVQNVESYISARNNNYCTLDPHHFDIDSFFPYILKRVSRSSGRERNLLFIDPYGYSKIKREVLEHLLANTHTEIILFLPISFMYRFTNAAVNDTNNIAQYQGLRDFIHSFFPEETSFASDNMNVHTYINSITSALRFSKDVYTTSYYIERSPSNYFALFFMTKHIYGFEKILEVKWLLDENKGKGFNIPDPTGNLFEEVFAKEDELKNSKELEQYLKDFLKTARTNRELYEFVLRKEFLPKHANQILKDLHKKNKISAVLEDGQPTRKGAYYINYKGYTGQVPHIVTFKLI